MPEIENDPFDFLETAPVDRLPQALNEIPAEDLAFLIYSRSPQQIGEWMRESRPSLLRDVLEQAMRLEQTPRAELYPGAQELALVLRACLGGAGESEAAVALPVEPEVEAFVPDQEPPGLRTEPALEAVSDVALALSLEPEPSFEPSIELESTPEAQAVAHPCEVELSYECVAGELPASVDGAFHVENRAQTVLEDEISAAISAQAVLAAEALLAAQVELEDEAELFAEAAAIAEATTQAALAAESVTEAALEAEQQMLASRVKTEADAEIVTEALVETQARVFAAPELTTTIFVNPAPIQVAAPLPVPVIPTPPSFRDYERTLARLMTSPARRREARILDFLQKESPELSALLGEADYFRIDDQITDSIESSSKN
jgi:hypothetical protein